MLYYSLTRIQMRSKDTAVVLKRPKKSKLDKLSTQADVDRSPEKSKKKKANAPSREHSEQQPDTSQKKEKKRKRMDAEEQVESMDHKALSEEAEGESGPPKKKHKNRTNFADPREDTKLNTQSRKGAHYIVWP